MHKYLLCLAVLLLFTCSSGTKAQKAFEGRILFSIQYIEIPTEYQGVENALPKELLWVIKNENSRMQRNTPLGGEQITIHRQGEDSLYQLMDVLGQKIKLTLPVNTYTHRFRVTEKEEVRQILGHEVKKFLLQGTNGTVLYAWSATRFKNPLGSDLPEIKGLPLEYEYTRNGIKMHLSAVQIIEEPVDETYFLIPEDYTAIPKETYHQWLR